MLDKARAVAWAELHRRQRDTESTGASLKATVRLDCDLILAMKRDPPLAVLSQPATSHLLSDVAALPDDAKFTHNFFSLATMFKRNSRSNSNHERSDEITLSS
jgi:hypothetical protein